MRALLTLLLFAGPLLGQANGWAPIENGWAEIQSTPASGTVTTTGTLASGQVALGSGATSITGDSGCTWTGTGANFTLTVGGKLYVPDGTAANAPGLAFATDHTSGLYNDPSYGGTLVMYGARHLAMTGSSVRIPVGMIRIGDGADDAWITNEGTADRVSFKHLNADQIQRSYGPNGTFRETGSVSELLTIAAAASTDTTIDLPANSVIRAVTVRVVTVIPTATAFDVGDPTTAARFATGVPVAATTTAVGLTHTDQTGAAGPKQLTAAKVRITPNGTPATATGQVRVTIFYDQFLPGTS